MSRRDEERRAREEQHDIDSMIVPGMSEIEIERAVRLRITRWHKKRSEFMGHLTSYLVVNGGLWIAYFSSSRFSDNDFPWPAMVTLFWGLGLIGHAADTWKHSPAVKARNENMIQNEVEREKQRLGLYEKAKRSDLEKPKRAQPMRLTDEGELASLDELLDAEDQEDAALRARTNRRGR